MYSTSDLENQLYFFYGTLRDPAVLGLVLSNNCAPFLVSEVKYKGHRLMRAKGEDFPIIESSSNLHDFALGDLYRGIGEEGKSRLIYFEGEEYDLRSFKIDGFEVFCFFPSDLSYETEGRWDFKKWRAQSENYKTYLAQVSDYMSHFGLDSDFKWKD